MAIQSALHPTRSGSVSFCPETRREISQRFLVVYFVEPASGPYEMMSTAIRNVSDKVLVATGASGDDIELPYLNNEIGLAFPRASNQLFGTCISPVPPPTNPGSFATRVTMTFALPLLVALMVLAQM